MREVLEGADEWAVIEAENGKEAVEKAQEFRPQLVILDLAMPVMDGLTASREIVKILPGTPILLHTLYSSPEIALEAGKSGVAKIVPKSEASALVSAVHEALHSGTIAALEKSAAVVSSETTSERRRTEDRVRALCMLLLTAKDDKVIEATLVELRDALHQHVEHFRARLAEYPDVSERRVRVADAAQENRTENNVIEMTNGKSEQAEISPNPKVSNG
jgi:DNA-binding NarL/FixJ family response regulator